MRLVIILFVSVFLSCGVPKQLTLPSSNIAENVYIDKFSNIYTLTADRQVVQYNPAGKELFRFANNQQGAITHVDVTNSQNILAYQADYGTLIILDNTLAELTTLDLGQLNYLDIKAIATSNDGNYWIYDHINWQLIKIDRAGKKIVQSNRLSDYNLKPFEPIFLKERNNKVYLSTTDETLIIFDNLGQYDKHIKLEGIGKFTVISDVVSYLYNGEITSFDLLQLENYAVDPLSSTKSMDIIDFTQNQTTEVYLKRDGTFTINQKK